MKFLLILIFSSLFTLSAFAQNPDTSMDFAVGKALFDRNWTPAPASTDATDGLGPLFNARSCAACHRNGGRGTCCWLMEMVSAVVCMICVYKLAV